VNPAPSAPEIVLVNGAPGGQLSALDRGLHYGDGLFETLGCVAGRVRFLPLHLRRLARGCARLALPGPDLVAVGRELEGLAAGCERAIVKLILTRGPALARGYRPSGAETATRIALRYPWPQVPEEGGAPGLRVRIADLKLAENPATAGIKHLNRLEQVLAQADGVIRRSPRRWFSRSGALVSGTMSNVFLVHAGVLLTPRLDLCGVAGVMREVVLGAAGECGLRAEERVLSRTDLEQAEEIFLTSALTNPPRQGNEDARWASRHRPPAARDCPLLTGNAPAVSAS
jgi:4-amino-4-deoxychorismate lyase